MLNSKTIVSKLFGASVAMVVFFCLTAQQGGEKKANVKKLYETKTKEFQEYLKEAQEAENMEMTDNILRKLIDHKAKEECEKEIQGDRSLIITSKPMYVMINECMHQKTPEMWKRRNEIKKNFQKELKDEVAELREKLTLEGCKKAAEKDKDCTDDLIVKFDRFGTCICESY